MSRLTGNVLNNLLRHRKNEKGVMNLYYREDTRWAQATILDRPATIPLCYYASSIVYLEPSKSKRWAWYIKTRHGLFAVKEKFNFMDVKDSEVEIYEVLQDKVRIYSIFKEGNNIKARLIKILRPWKKIEKPYSRSILQDLLR